MDDIQLPNSDGIQLKSKNPPNNMGKLLGCLGIFFILICILALVFGIFKFNLNSSSIYITEAVVTTNIDEAGNPDGVSTSFLPTQPRIYCLVKVEASQPVNVGIRWYLENDLVFQDQQLVDQWRAFYIEPLPGHQFIQGNYRVEIYLVSDALRTINFTVKE